MTTLLLARHGETEWHAENLYAGTSDVSLTANGHEQAKQLGRWAAEAGIEAVWCSPLSRARATAAPAAAALGLALCVDSDLREVDFGVAEGRRLTDLDPALAEAFRHDPVAGAFPHAEDPRSAAERGVAALRRIANRHPDGRTLVVAHNTLLRLVLCSLLGVPLSRYRAVFPQVRNCALTELRLGRSSAALLAYNVPVGCG